MWGVTFMRDIDDSFQNKQIYLYLSPSLYQKTRSLNPLLFNTYSYPLVNVCMTMEHRHFLMGKSTTFLWPCSQGNCTRLPEGNRLFFQYRMFIGFFHKKKNMFLLGVVIVTTSSYSPLLLTTTSTPFTTFSCSYHTFSTKKPTKTSGTSMT